MGVFGFVVFFFFVMCFFWWWCWGFWGVGVFFVLFCFCSGSFLPQPKKESLFRGALDAVTA